MVPKNSLGSLRVSSNGRYLVDGKGQPFFWLGDTSWPLFGQYTRQEAEQWLESRANAGFTVVQCVLGWGGGTGFETKLPGSNYAGDPPGLAGQSILTKPILKMLIICSLLQKNWVLYWLCCLPGVIM